ncbi:OLC1v1021006C1 [Oldenlandia corymbosa var. corymbosa]|uniref:OLC1v1021006C1 n=1 Tax=Oldenlandia corymbosa var. corymbosa TaxID=529605 RepID=A0AAV1BWW7_OLDCO|nr:OLC1v1021006C1 [Oldenlandia corymbosa var. corymbosa]
MAKYNVVLKQKRAAQAEQKRAKYGDPVSNKLTQKSNPNYPLHSVSGKRKRKLFKKWRREQKEALAKGLVTMQDVEMAVADGGASKDATKSSIKFHMKKAPKLKSRLSKKSEIKHRRKFAGQVAESSSSSAIAMEE